MKIQQKFIFVVVFFAIIYGLVKLHEYSLTEQTQCTGKQTGSVTSVSIGNFVDITNISDLEERSDIPFEILIDPDLKQNLPDTINYDAFKPNKVFLEKGFDANNPNQLKEFGNIVVIVNSIPGLQKLLEDKKMFELLSDQLKGSIDKNAESISATITDWQELPLSDLNDASIVMFRYVQTKKDGRQTINVVSCIFKNDHQVQVIMSAPNRDAEVWMNRYQELLESVYIR